MPLTIKAIQAAKPRQKAYKLSDSAGLFLLIQPNSRRYWRFKYRFAGREKLLSLGQYPSVSLAQARETRDEFKKQLAAGDDPSVIRQEKKAAEKAAKVNTFAAIARRWSDDYHEDKTDATSVRNERILKYVITDLGDRSIQEIKRSHLKSTLLSIKKNHGTETAHRALSLSRMVFEDAASDDLIVVDPTFGLKKKLGQAIPQHRLAITDPAEFGQLLRDIWNYNGQPVTLCALRILAYTFLRPGELRKARWREINFETREFIIPVERLKMRRKIPEPHLVPLTDETLAIFKELFKLTGPDPERYVFPTNRPGRPLSENSFRIALLSLGYEGRHVAHGFRRSASTLLNRLKFDRRVIEKQLNHVVGGVEGIYNIYCFESERRVMMEQWSAYIDQLRTDRNVAAHETWGASR